MPDGVPSRGPAAGDFRADINGLRALAVAAVIAFHLAGLPGGFVGVDVFFVISGYLMTRIIVTRLDQGRFGLWSFYLARARRIWPALAALCAGLWLAGATLLDPWTFQRMAGDLAAALAFVANFVFAGRRGYFAPDERSNWLLHTWSLAVEWQFYLLFPLLLMGLFAVPALRRRLWPALAALAALSFALGLWQGAHDPRQAFYGLPARAWELLAGGLCFGLEPRLALGGRARGVGHVAGLALIGLGCWLARPDAAWPSAMTLLPVGGAALVVASAAPRTLWANNAVIAAIGRASYSIYLWHWPLIVGLRYEGIALTWPVALATAAAAVAAGLASYWLVERLATGWVFSGRRTALAGIVGLAAVAGLSVAAAQTRGFEAWRIQGVAPPIRAALADDRRAASDWAFPTDCGRHVASGGLDLCYVGDPAARNVLVLGDSHAQQLVARYAHAFDGRPGAGATFLTDAGCLPIPGVELSKPGSRCAAWSQRAYRWAEASSYRRVVIVSAWVIYFDATPAAPTGITCLAAGGGGCAPPGLTRDRLAAAEFARLQSALAALRAAGKEVVVVGPTPQTDDADPMRLYRLAFQHGDLDPAPLPRVAFDARAALVLRLIGKASRAAGATEVEPLDHLCPDGACPLSLGGRALYKDRGHFRASRMGEPRYGYLDPWIM